jgi:hypothetical protein
MDLDERSKLLEGLLKLAADAETNPWSGRLYVAAALWLETEIRREGGPSHDPATSIAAEVVRHREFGPEPELFRGCVDAWLYPTKEG